MQKKCLTKIVSQPQRHSRRNGYQSGAFPHKLAIKFSSHQYVLYSQNNQQESKNAYKTSERLEKSQCSSYFPQRTKNLQSNRNDRVQAILGGVRLPLKKGFLTTNLVCRKRVCSTCYGAYITMYFKNKSKYLRFRVTVYKVYSSVYSAPIFSAYFCNKAAIFPLSS